MNRRLMLGGLAIGAGALILLAPLAVRQFRLAEQRRMVERLEWAALRQQPRPVGPGQTQVTPPGQAPATEPEPPGAPTPATPEPDPEYLIEIPKLGVRYVVMPTIENDDLARGPGHYPGTGLPGQPGNAAIAGHRTVKGIASYFYNLHLLAPGDTIIVRYPDSTLTFTVERVFITGAYDLTVLAPTPYPALTLTTCDPPGTDEHRLIVQA
ncbi:MAG TPA: class E sortase, partial [Symbiobacteriaceae bacterium]|nr:class E sortase [Symbiobacteriaceae bacterium]